MNNLKFSIPENLIGTKCCNKLLGKRRVKPWTTRRKATSQFYPGYSRISNHSSGYYILIVYTYHIGLSAYFFLF